MSELWTKVWGWTKASSAWLSSRPYLRTWQFRAGGGLIAAGLLIMLVQLWGEIDQRLSEGVFANTINVYAAPRLVAKGDSTTPEALARLLQKAGYTDASDNPIGYYRIAASTLEIRQGPGSYFRVEPARVEFENGKISRIVAIQSGETLDQYLLEPQLMANLSNSNRERRRLVEYDDLPPHLVQALLSAEDKRFFEHFGFDSLRLVKVIFVNLRSGSKEQGGSTITMQLARNIWLDARKTWRRKFTEALITLILEVKLSKKQILEHYANQVYLGRRETFDLHGFGEGARALFNKEVGQLSVAESALLCGIIQRPSYFDPVRHPDEARERRNTVLALMQRNGYLTAEKQAAAAAEPLGISKRVMGAEDAPYFVALARDEARTRLGKTSIELNSGKIYTTVDLELQRAATEAVSAGMEQVDKRLAALIKSHPEAAGAIPQVALVALDPHTGEVKAAVGGRDYGISQVNRVLAKRQPGSAFKPFVFAAALAGPNDKPSRKFTIASVLTDQPTAFKYGDEVYEPANFGEKYMGYVTYRSALARSLNNATVSLAEQIGYGRVSQIAKAAGLTNVHATPSIALGSYEASPLELAGAYTVFANDGVYVEPTFLAELRDAAGKSVHRAAPITRRVLDPKVNWLMLDMLRDVVRSGTAAGSGLNADAAGKTGTSRDGWFAGFTSGLICVVWVGFDDNRELPLEGAKSALVVWAEFMKRAIKLGDFAKPLPGPPQGIVSLEVDTMTGMLPGPNCPDTLRQEWFIAGTEPTAECTPPPELPVIEEDPTKAVAPAHVARNKP